MMLVRDLMAMLEKMHPDARVLMVREPRWPWEHDVAHVVVRKDIECNDRDEHWERDDVLLLEGDRVGFGPEFAWADANRAAGAPGG